MTARENLLRLMNIPQAMGLDGVVKTADGHYIGRVQGDCGYNAFIGKPAPVHPGPGLDCTLETWAGMSQLERDGVRALAAVPVDGEPIDLADFGVPEGDN